MFQMMIRTLPLVFTLIILQSQPSLGDPESCADAVLAAMQNNNNALYHSTMKMMVGYNETCWDINMCKYQMSDDTAAYMYAATKTEGTPGLPDFPVTGTADADFGGFSTDQVDEYKSLCAQEGGSIILVDVDLRVKGTGMDLIDIDIDLKADEFPMCFAAGCEDEDYEKVLEEAVKASILKNAKDLSDGQANVLKSMDIDLACVAAGIEECRLTVTKSGESKTSLIDLNKPSDSSSGSSFLAGKFTGLAVAVFWLFASLY